MFEWKGIEEQLEEEFLLVGIRYCFQASLSELSAVSKIFSESTQDWESLLEGTSSYAHGLVRRMNSLNILSARVIGRSPSSTPTTSRTRSRSLGEALTAPGLPEYVPRRSATQPSIATPLEEKDARLGEEEIVQEGGTETPPNEMNEKSPLLAPTTSAASSESKSSKLRLVTKRLADAIAASLKWVLSTLASPGIYVIRCFYDDRGHFAPLIPIRKLTRLIPRRNGSKSTTQAVGLSGSPDLTTSSKEKRNARRSLSTKQERPPSKRVESLSSATSESDIDVVPRSTASGSQSLSRLKSRATSSSEDNAPTRRSIRIKLINEDTTRRRRQKKTSTSTDNSTTSDLDHQTAVTAASLKSPTSVSSSLRLTKYPRAPAPPQPLIPLNQPSYSSASSRRPSHLAQKTLVLDLDETLIHSLSKGGRMSSGHMVEVKLPASLVSPANSTNPNHHFLPPPQHPILYYVHKRPHCDDFLRKVCRWYKLVIFTASVQEYADPVIDWLEQERKVFSARYYRQHCTFRNGAYVKDLSTVEPDLSRVIILDNSPLSYYFHEGEQHIQLF